AGASTQITISLSSLLSEEKFRRFLKENSELFIEVMNQSSEKGKAIDRAERAVRDSDATIRKNQQAIFKRIEANETAQLKAMQHIVSFLDAKGKTGLLDDINKVYEREKERRGL
ncbi:clindamycin resistance transfer factor btgA, partial [Phocaeicola vulgatus]